MLIRFVLKHQRTVNHKVVVGDVLRKTNLMDGLTIDTVELAVLDSDVIDGIGQLGVVITYNHHTILRLLAGNILHRDVADGRIETTTAHLAGLVVGIDLKHGLATLPNSDVAHVDILDDASTAGVRLDTQHAVQRRGVHLAVVGIDILTTAGDLRTDDHTTVTVVELRVTDNDILRRTADERTLTTLTTVVIAAALDSYAVVTRVEIAVLDEHAVARLGIATVAVGSIIINMYAAHGNIC